MGELGWKEKSGCIREEGEIVSVKVQLLQMLEKPKRAQALNNDHRCQGPRPTTRQTGRRGRGG